MRTILVYVCLLAMTFASPMLHAAQDEQDALLESRYQTYAPQFEAAYRQYPDMPRGILEAVSWTNTRMVNRQPETSQPSCVGIPQVSGVMGLMVDGAGWFRENANMIAHTARISPAAMRTDVGVQVMAYAQALDAAARASQGDLRDPATWLHAVASLSEIPAEHDPVSNYALQAQLYSIGTFMLDSEAQAACQFPAQALDLEAFFGKSNYRVLSATAVQIEGEEVRAGQSTFEPMTTRVTTTDYGPAIWNAAASCNYSSRSGTAVSAITIHTTQGSYSGAISWFQNCSASVSAHYVIRSSDGQVTQMVLESDKAWHVGSENPYTVGIENEGYVDDAAWYTTPLYAACVDLTRDIADDYSISKVRTYAGPPTTGTNLLSVNCFKIKGHQHFPNQTHNDPGLYWDWERFFRLLNGTPSTTVYTTSTGTLYDAGGSGANYGNDQRQAWRISPTGATSVTLTFSSFNCENNYDYLHIYDGTSDKGQLIGKYTGTTLPPAVTARSGSIFLEFRSDCATTAAGWAASWTSSTTPLSCGYPTSISTTNINAFGATFNWAAAAGATGYEVRWRQSLSTTWTTPVTVTGTSYTATGFKSNSGYYWQVRTKCAGPTYSTWAGTGFETIAAASASTTLCSGTFRDSGGDIANYRNGESYTYTIAPAGATSVTMTFTSFNVESGYDYLYLYNGPTTASPLIGSYTGTTSPGTKTATSGTMTVRFVSDSWTTKPGWLATWSCVGGSLIAEAAEPGAAPNWTVAPNPFETALRLDLTAPGMHSVRILDLQGRNVFQREFMGATYHDLPIQHLAAGAYLLQVTSPEGIPSQRRIVRQ